MIRIASLLLTLGLCLSRVAAAETPLRVATCARTITTGVGAAFAVATKLGWFRQEGLAVEIVPLPGSTDCTKSVATRDVPIALPSVEPLAIVRPQGVKIGRAHV